MSINSDDVESVSVEILFENRKNTIFNVLYKQPKGQIEPFEKFWKEIFPRIKNSNKELHVAGEATSYCKRRKIVSSKKLLALIWK